MDVDPAAHPVGSATEECDEYTVRGDDVGIDGEHHPPAQVADIDSHEIERRAPAAVDALDR